MRAVILAAGIGWRMGGGPKHPPKCLLRFGGKTLLQRHLELLEYCGVDEVVIGVGYRAEDVHAELAALDTELPVETLFNDNYERGNIVTLWVLREELRRGGDVLLMDADVLYDHRLLRRLLASRHANCFLLDRDLEPGEEPVKVCVRGGRLVEFRKRVAADLAYDFHGESVGFFRLSAEWAGRLAALAEDYVRRGRTDELYDEALRDLLLSDGGASFGFEDITGLPWIEIDFPQDVHHAQSAIVPRLEEIPELLSQHSPQRSRRSKNLA